MGEARCFSSLSPESVGYALGWNQRVPSPLSLLAPSLTWGPIFLCEQKKKRGIRSRKVHKDIQMLERKKMS